MVSILAEIISASMVRKVKSGRSILHQLRNLLILDVRGSEKCPNGVQRGRNFLSPDGATSATVIIAARWRINSCQVVVVCAGLRLLSAWLRLVSARLDLVCAWLGLVCAEAGLVYAGLRLVCARLMLVSARLNLVCTWLDLVFHPLSASAESDGV